jgi:branched-chain amino acid aminotransferase
VRANHLPAGYLRPIVLRGYGEVGVNPAGCPIDVYIATWAWGKYLGAEAIEKGVDVCVASWQRMHANTLPAVAKAAANYMNSQLIKMEAVANGYSEGIALDGNGLVSEGSGENLFLVRHGVLYTPPLSASILPGITRDSVIQLAGDLGLTVKEQNLPRELLYLADELFFSGTAVEITPIRSVDRIQVGNGQCGPITKKLQQEFFGIIEGRIPDRYKWLHPVGVAEPALR